MSTEKTPQQITSVEDLFLLKQRHYGSMIIAGVEAVDRYLELTPEERAQASQPEQDPIYLDSHQAYEQVSAKIDGKVAVE